MKEIVKIDEDGYFGSQEHLFYSKINEYSIFMKVIKDKSYKSHCVIYYGDQVAYEGECDFKLRQSPDHSLLLIFRIDRNDLGHSMSAKSIEVILPDEIF